MAEEQNQHQYVSEETEVKDRGLFGFGGKKEGEDQEAIKRPEDQEVVANEFEKVEVYEEPIYQKEEEKNPTLAEQLHRSHSNKSISSSSSDEEEVGEDGEKKKKKKGLKEKIFGDKKEAEFKDTSVPIEKIEAEPVTEEKKGFIEKIKEKFPSGDKKAEMEAVDLPPAAYQSPPVVEEEKEKKGLLEKIKEKLPGYHKNGEEKEKEIETPATATGVTGQY